MIIQDATADTLQLDAVERSGYSFRSLTPKVVRKELNEPFVSEKELVAAGFLLAPFWETPGDLEGDAYRGYIADHPEFTMTVRRGVYERLVIAQKQLPPSWQIVLKAGFRPYDVQLRLIEVFMDESRRRFPDRTESEHLAHAQTFVADPRIVCPPHVTGGAVDVAIRNVGTDLDVDMGCPPNTDSDIAFLHSDQLSSVQRDNRMVLLNAMLTAGFAPNVNEWWHYQYGETYWAAFYGHTSTLYDLQGI